MKRVILLITAIVIALPFGCKREQVDEYAIVTFLIGDVTRNNKDLEIGEIINEKDKIKTGKDSFCDIKIGESIIRVKQKSSIIFSSMMHYNNIEDTTLKLNIGKVLCKPKKLLKSEKFVVKTPTAVAGVRGTKFVVEADKKLTTRIKVFDGKVKVARRLKQFEDKVPEVLDVASSVQKEEKVVITKKETIQAEKQVAELMKKESAKGKTVELASLIKKSENAVIIPKQAIVKFNVKDFEKDKKEIIAIEQKRKTPKIIKQIVKVIKEEKKQPKPDGRLLITRYEIYFIKNGKVQWEGNVINEPIHNNEKVYIASGKYVFCASTDGPVLWRKEIINNGSLKIEDNKLTVQATDGKAVNLDLDTGENL